MPTETCARMISASSLPRGQARNPRSGVALTSKIMESANDNRNERVGSKVDDETLAHETLAGKRWAQQEVWYRFAPMVYGLLRRSLNPKHEHDDLVQEVFLRFFRRLDSLENPSALRSFIYSIALRVVSEEVRHFYVIERARKQLVHISPETTVMAADFEARDTLAKIQGILDSLKAKHRAVFVLRHVEGMSLQEISIGLDLSLATVKRYLVKGMRSIHRAASRDSGLRMSLLQLLPDERSEEGE
jgi:RNA polymerase sigma-70 factor, ECF subfamily